MTYLRNPRQPMIWESDGEYDKPGYKAIDGTICKTWQEADERDRKWLAEFMPSAKEPSR
jgi:hypothetical protein